MSNTQRGFLINYDEKLSLTYRFLRFIGLNYSEEEYGDVSLFKVIGKFLETCIMLFIEYDELGYF